MRTPGNNNNNSNKTPSLHPPPPSSSSSTGAAEDRRRHQQEPPSSSSSLSFGVGDGRCDVGKKRTPPPPLQIYSDRICVDGGGGDKGGSCDDLTSGPAIQQQQQHQHHKGSFSNLFQSTTSPSSFLSNFIKIKPLSSSSAGNNKNHGTKAASVEDAVEARDGGVNSINGNGVNGRNDFSSSSKEKKNENKARTIITSTTSTAPDCVVVTHEHQRRNQQQQRQLTSPSPSFDEKEEWNKISEIMDSISSGLGEKDSASTMASGSEIKDWLTRIGHPDLLVSFLSRGFDDIQFLGSGLLEDADLADMGVRDPRIRRRILEEVARLPCKLPRVLMSPSSLTAKTWETQDRRKIVDKFDTVESWLSFLNLDFYASKFHRYRYNDIEKVRKMWEAELTTILEITLPGHKKRILASIGTNEGCDSANGKPAASSLSSSASSLASTLGRGQVSSSTAIDTLGERELASEVTADLSRLTDEISQYQTKIRDKLGYNPSSPTLSVSATLQHADHETNSLNRMNRLRNKKGKAPSPPSLVPPSFGNEKLSGSNDDLLVTGHRFIVGSSDEARPLTTLSRLSLLPLREPKEIAADAELAARGAPPHWLHPATTLIRGTCDYSAYYVGSVLIRHLEGINSSRMSIKRLRKAEDIRKRVKISLSVSYTGVRVLDSRSKMLVSEHMIQNINSACQDDDDLSYFAYIVLEESTGDHICHVFVCDTSETSSDIMLTLGQAFEVAYQLTLRHWTSPESLHAETSPPAVKSTPVPSDDLVERGRQQQIGRPSLSSILEDLVASFATTTAGSSGPTASSSVWEVTSAENRGHQEDRGPASESGIDSLTSGNSADQNRVDAGHHRRPQLFRKTSTGSSSSSGADLSPLTVPRIVPSRGGKVGDDDDEARPKSSELKNDVKRPPIQGFQAPVTAAKTGANDKPALSNANSSGSEGGVGKPRIPEKPRHVPPKPAHLVGSSPVLLRKASSTPRVDVVVGGQSGGGGNGGKGRIGPGAALGVPAWRRAPLASSEDF